MEAKKFNDFIGEERVDEKLKMFMDDILAKMIPAAFSYRSNAKMRDELKVAIANAIEPILKKYDIVVENNEIVENVVLQNINSEEFDGSDPKTIEVWNAGVGGVRTLQQHREQIVKMLEQMLKDAETAEKNHKIAHYSIEKILGLMDEARIGGVFLKYLKNHQAAVEELENMRKRGGSGKNKTIPKGLI
jgi:hypothetical protein